MELLNYLDEIGAEYEVKTSILVEDAIPIGMREFYAKVQKADLSFGRIYDVKKALEMSLRAHFAPMWFVFGQDNYSSFWLCRREPDEE